MRNEFVPYNIALAMKELGFDEPCLGVYLEFGGFTLSSLLSQVEFKKKKNCLAPLYRQAFRWFRGKGFNFYIDSHTLDGKGKYKDYFFNIDREGEYIVRINHRDGYATYEEAEFKCLEKLIEIVKENL